ncbi:MAG: hypothetical protein NZ750_14350 [Anaerolineae bacterium]|nr:hypothetical protein [Anaerolineae bacterium]MDW8170923.1 hypothetical protein [Anaerolineae bacterium]
MAWLMLDYEPLSPFILRPSNTTSTGGKSLLAPTPYAIKMGLLDRLIRHRGLAEAQAFFPVVRDLTLYLRVPLAASVNRTFQKILRDYKPESGWVSTIVQIEFCVFAGVMSLAVPLPDDSAQAELLTQGFCAINYFGRRGGFMQLQGWRTSDAELSADFVNLCQPNTALLVRGFLQRMDDMEARARFEDVSIFNPKAKGGRRTYNVVFPYQLAYHGSNHTVYERMAL